jgi:hypothetical protein
MTTNTCFATNKYVRKLKGETATPMKPLQTGKAKIIQLARQLASMHIHSPPKLITEVGLCGIDSP